MNTSGSALTAQVSLNIGVTKVVWTPFEHCKSVIQRGAGEGNLYLRFTAKEWKKLGGEGKMIVCEADKITATTQTATGGKGCSN